MDQQETLEAKENEIEAARRRQVEKGEDSIIFDGDALMGKEQRCETSPRTQRDREFIAETVNKLAERTHED